MIMHKRIMGSTQAPLALEDADSAAGRELVRDFSGEYDQGGASALDYTTWLPFAAQRYHISPRIEDYVLSVTPLCPADIPNRNGVGFPLAELKSFAPPPQARMVYKCWAGCPTHLEHCFPAYTLVRTNKGLKPIEDIQKGDKVLTHNRRYRKVTRLYRNGVKSLTRIDAYGLTKPLFATENHPVWVVGRGQIFPATGSAKARELRLTGLEEVRPHHRPVSDIYALDYLVAPITVGGSVEVSADLAFLTGAYMAEGNLCPSNTSTDLKGVTLTIAYNESDFRKKLVCCAETLGLTVSVSYSKSRGTCSVYIQSKRFARLMKSLCGTYSHKKRMKGELRKWNKPALRAFLGGYITGDGSNNGLRIRCRTASEDLAQDIQMTLGRLGVPASANADTGWGSMFTDSYFTKNGTLRKNKGGKPYRNSGESFCVGASIVEFAASGIMEHLVGPKTKILRRKRKKDVGPRVIVHGDYLLLPISGVFRDVEREEVYNIEVEEDHTYVAGGVIVHNCNKDYTKAFGVVLDTSLHKIKLYGGGTLWKVMALVATDKVKNPRIAQRVHDRDLKTYSMGTTANLFTCSLCGEPIVYADEGDDIVSCCSHIDRNNSDLVFYPYRDMYGQTHAVYKNAHGLQPFEFSLVEDPAWPIALSDTLLQM